MKHQVHLGHCSHEHIEVVFTCNRSRGYKLSIMDGAKAHVAPSLTGSYWWLVAGGVLGSITSGSIQAHTDNPNENQWGFAQKYMKV